jgi:hypothetical protein
MGEDVQHAPVAGTLYMGRRERSWLSPARLADPLRGHWAIEALHHLRAVTFCEDASQVRTSAGPHVMACLRNVVIGVLRATWRGPPRVPARRHAQR